jgi:hypothetical protein
MWKLSFTLLFILNLVIGIMLFWQWNVYSQYNEQTSGKKAETAEQEITVETKEKLLEVTQKIKGLHSEKEYRIMVPDTISEWSCLKEDGNTCDSLDENPLSFLAENGTLKVTYSLTPNKNGPFLLNEWMVRFPDVSIEETTIEIIDSTRRDGTWVAGFPLKGHNKLDLIDYYVFKGEGQVSSLYWQPSPLEKLKGSQSVQFFVKDKTQNIDFSFEALRQVPNFSGMSVVFTDAFADTNGNGLMIASPDTKVEVLERKIIYNYLLDLAPNLPLEERWLIDVLSSILTGLEVSIPKGNEFINELRNNLTDDELEQFKTLIFEKESISPQSLDEVLGFVKGKSTHFFTLNKNEETKLVPLYFYDSRKVYIQDEVQEDIEVLLINDEKLLPFVETMSALGYEVKLLSDEETLLLTKGHNSYRFYVNQNIFIYNQEDYGLLENPLKRIEGQIYMDASWLKSLLKVTIEETNTEFKLTNSF